MPAQAQIPKENEIIPMSENTKHFPFRFLSVEHIVETFSEHVWAEFTLLNLVLNVSESMQLKPKGAVWVSLVSFADTDGRSWNKNA